MKTSFTYIIFILILFGGTSVFSQQQTLADVYMLDRSYLNPAYTGTTVRMPVIVTTRQQWAQISHGPSTQAVSIHTRIRNSNIKFTDRGFLNRGLNSAGNIGVGGFIFNHKSGALNRTGIQLNYAYHIPFDNARLSLGISGSIMHYSILTSGFTLPDEGIIDPAIEKAKETTWIPDAHFGAFLYNDNYFIGFSANQLLGTSVLLGNKEAFDSEIGDYDYDRIRQYYVEAGYKFKIGFDWELEPSILYKTTEKGNSRLDINARVIWDQNYWLGVSYRTQKAVIAMLGLKFENLIIAYCYEQELSDIRSYNFNSHQIMAGIRIGERHSGKYWR